MSTVVVEPGLTMATVDEVLAQLGPDVTAEMLRWWHRRYGLRRARLDGQWWYHVEGAIELEWTTAASGRGRPRHAGRRGAAGPGPAAALQSDSPADAVPGVCPQPASPADARG